MRGTCSRCRHRANYLMLTAGVPLQARSTQHLSLLYPRLAPTRPGSPITPFELQWTDVSRALENTQPT